MPIDCTVVTKLILLVVRAFAAITSLSPIPSTQTGTNDWTWISFEIRLKRQRTKLLLVSRVVVDDDDRAVHCFYRSFMHPLLIVRSFDLHACYSMHSSISSLIQWVIRFDCHPTCPFIHLFTDQICLPTTVYWFVDWRDVTTIIHDLFINIGLSLKLILVINIENNCCGHPIFGQGSIPWQLTMENIMTMTNKPSRAF